MLKRLVTICCILFTFSLHAQNTEERIGTLMAQSRWFDLARELRSTPEDSVNPVLYKMACAMTQHYFNRPEQACVTLGDLLNNHSAELGDNTFNMALFLSMNLARCGQYDQAAELMQNLCSQLKGLGVDSIQTAGFEMLANQYLTYAENAPILKQLHPAGTYTVPMGMHNAMHTVKDKSDEGHFITMDGLINGKASTLVFDTGAGGNILSTAQAREFGLRLLGESVEMAGIGTQYGTYAIADTLRIGDMAWANVPFLVVDIKTDNAEVDSTGSLLPPVIGLPLMFCMQEIQLDFEHRQFIIPSTTTPNPLGESNLLRTESEVLRFATKDADGEDMYLHFDTGGYNTTLLPRWYERHKDEVQALGTQDSLRVAGVGGVYATHSYWMPEIEFRIGNGSSVLDSVIVSTGIDLRSGEKTSAEYLNGEEDGTLGLDILEHFRLVILNLKEMYMEAIPY